MKLAKLASIVGIIISSILLTAGSATLAVVIYASYTFAIYGSVLFHSNEALAALGLVLFVAGVGGFALSFDVYRVHR